MMSVTMESVSFTNPNPNPTRFLAAPHKRASITLRSSPPSPSVRFHSDVATRALSLRFLPLSLWSSRNPSAVSFSASHEDSKHSEIEVESKNDLDLKAKESEEAWEQTLESFKEQALKMKSVSQEAYELYSKKAMIIFTETAVQLKIQADKAAHDLSLAAKEISEDGKEYLNAAAHNSPEPLKDIVETFASADHLNEISKVYDFYLGIPYGLLLSLGGFISFMITGSVAAVRFGVILGGALLALSISSLKSWKRGETFALSLKGQTVIAGVLFLRELLLLSQRCSLFSFSATLISGAMLAFYLYRITLSGAQREGSNLEPGTED